MSNLDLSILEIMRGDTPVLKIMKGDVEKWPCLPYDSEVEYLESTGTQYINTGVHLFTESPTSLGITMRVDVSTSQSTYSVILGSMKEKSPYPGIVIRTSSNNIQIARGSEGAPPTIGTCGSVQSITRNENNLTFVHNTPVTIFAGLDGNNAPFRYCKLKLYYLKIVRNNNPMMELIPVRKDGIGYLYDKVSETLFGNQGSGSFNYGNDVVPLPEIPYDAQVEYLQGDESAYIDTGINMRKKTTSVLKVLVPSLPSAIKIFYGAFMDNLSVPKFQIGVRTTANWLLGQPSGGTANGASNSGSFTLNQIYDITLTCPVQASDSTIYLFARNNDIDDKLPCNVKIYSLIIISDGVIVRDFIPVRVGQVGYMYDKVTKQLFGNANSTGAFTYGNDV